MSENPYFYDYWNKTSILIIIRPNLFIFIMIDPYKVSHTSSMFEHRNIHIAALLIVFIPILLLFLSYVARCINLVRQFNEINLKLLKQSKTT